MNPASDLPDEPATEARLRVRRAVREALARLPEPARSAPLVVGCSGGADSLALLHAAAALRPGACGAVVVDHGLQEGSAQRSAALAERLAATGVPAVVHRVVVEGGGGTEAAARRARYAALRAARPDPASPVLLGHTLDDQAETVLLGLGRGSGARSIAGMREWDEPWLRPLLGIRRVVTRSACAGLPVWEDPHNADPRFTRVRLRREVLPLLEEALGGGVAEALARTAAQLREDCEALDGWAARVRAEAQPGPAESAGGAGPVAGGSPVGEAGPAGGAGLLVEPLRAVPAAVRRRVLRGWLLASGVTELSDAQLRAADALVGEWHGQGGPALPGGLDLVRSHGRLILQHRAEPRAQDPARPRAASRAETR